MTNALYASELVTQLLNAIAEHGDLPVWQKFNRDVSGIEVDTEDGVSVFSLLQFAKGDFVYNKEEKESIRRDAIIRGDALANHS